MSFYIIENEHGNTMDYNGYFNCQISQTELFDEPNEPAKLAEELGGHVVELVAAPAKIVVSEDEAKMLTEAKTATYPAEYITLHSCLKQGSEDRLMRAYVNGWTVEKHKRYVLPMEGTKLADGTIAYATLDHTGVWTIKAYSEKQSAVAFHNTVTQAEIDAAPDWVKEITPAEVTDDEQNKRIYTSTN